MTIRLRSRSRPPSTEDILATTAHELRLPLSHIKGFVSTLRRTDVEWDTETRTELLADIGLEADRLALLGTPVELEIIFEMARLGLT